MNPRKEPDAEPLIARDATYYRAPEALRTRIRAAVGAEARERARPAMWRWGGLAAAFATVALVSWNMALLQAGGSDEERVLGEVATAHVRSLMVESHLNDVASTDQHTVKPWFPR
jgi:anti-sigma factor RsiW